MKTNRKGFTLIELVIVIAVIAILAALLIPTILNQVERARISRGKADVKELAVAIGRLRTDTANSAETCLTNFVNLTQLSAANTTGCVTSLSLCSTTTPGYICWDGPYINSIPVDPWSQTYYATEDTTTFIVTVASNGPDAISGDSDDITFIQ